MADDMDGLRRAAQESLPARMRAALAGYERFTADAPPDDAKGFAAWHAAAKAALVHVEVLVKLLRWAEGQGEVGDGLDRLLSQARHAIDQLDAAEDEA